MDEEIELTTVDGQTVRVALSGAVVAVGRAIGRGRYMVSLNEHESAQVRRVRHDDELPPEIEEDATAVAVAVDAAVTRVLDRRDVAESAEKRRLLLEQFDAENPDLVGERCHCSRDGEVCNWDRCPQKRDGEPYKSGRHCPLDRYDDEEA